MHIAERCKCKKNSMFFFYSDGKKAKYLEKSTCTITKELKYGCLVICRILLTLLMLSKDMGHGLKHS